MESYVCSFLLFCSLFLRDYSRDGNGKSMEIAGTTNRGITIPYSAFLSRMNCHDFIDSQVFRAVVITIYPFYWTSSIVVNNGLLQVRHEMTCILRSAIGFLARNTHLLNYADAI